MSTALTPAQRVLRARLGGLTTSARGHIVTGPAHAAFAAKFYAGIPEDLPPAERDRRAEAARRLYFTGLALKSSRTRAHKKAARAIVTPRTAAEGSSDAHQAAA